MWVVVPLLGSIAALLGIAILRKVLTFLYKLLRMKRLSSNIPSDPAYPLIGHAALLTTDADDIYDVINEMANKYGTTFKVWLGHTLLVFVTAPEDIEVVMNNCSGKADMYTAIVPFVGNGLVTLAGDDYRRHRKAITPSLHLNILNDFVEIFNEESNNFAEALGKLADEGKQFDVKPMCGYAANTIVCRSVFSVSVSEDEINRADFVDNIMPAQSLFMYRYWHPWLLNDWIFSWTSMSKEYERINGILEKFVQNVLRIKTEKLSSKTTMPQTKKREAFLEHILQSEESATLSRQELVEEMKTIASVASGSSMDALAFLCFILAIKPDIQKRLQQEVDDIFGGDVTRPIEPSDLPHLDFTERYIKEAMRYFAVVPLFSRRVDEDLKLPSGYAVPEGGQIAFWLPKTHMNPDIFPEPHVFDPDRFLPENTRGRHPYSYIPFSAGSRNCIGQRYAMMLMKTFVANIIRRIEILPVPGSPSKLEDIRLKMELTLSVRGEANIRTRRRVFASKGIKQGLYKTS